MTCPNSKIASKVLSALEDDYAGMPECDDHAGKAWRKLFKKADELGLLDDDLLLALMRERLARLGDANLRFERIGGDAQAAEALLPCSLEMRGTAAVLAVGNLDSSEAAALLEGRRQEVERAERLVIDLRDCQGGVEQAAYPLLDWLFDDPCDLAGLVGTQRVLTNYTQGSCKARIEQFSRLKGLIEAQGGAGTTSWLDQGIQAAQDNAGKGYVEESLAPAELPIQAAPKGQRVYLLTSGRTCDAAEWLALVAHKSGRVTQVGSATRGSLDYSNPVSVVFDGRFIFTYPMTKTVEAAQGKGIRGKGVAPDVTCEPDDALDLALGQ